MLLKNLMEDKKLNLNQPLLSVRRYSPTMASQKVDDRKIDNAPTVIPPHRSELKSGPVGNPGAVPFHWEETPGQPKEEIKLQTQNCNKPPIAPKLPPSRFPNAKHHCSNQVSSDTSDDKILAVNIRHDSQIGNIKKSKRIKEMIEESTSSSLGDCDEAYIDALDTLSRIQSFFLMEGLDKTNTSGNFSMDSQTRELIMDSFPPVAKAMASETSRYAPKKQSALGGQPQLRRKIVDHDKPALRYGLSFGKRYSHEAAEESNDDDCNQHGNLPAVCCLLPRFCLKSSVCVLGPVPGMSLRARVLISPDNRIQARLSSAGSFTKTENKEKSDISKSKPKNEVLGIPEETKNTGIKSFGSHGKGFETLHELLADQGSPKAVYVDAAQKVENMRSCSPNSQDNEIHAKRMNQIRVIVDSSLEDFKKLDQKQKVPTDNLDVNIDATSTEHIEVPEKEAIKNIEKQLARKITLGNSHEKCSEFHVPPPLPKSPSDSWLRRTLPSMSTKNMYHSSKTSRADIKWEAMVKSTKMQHHNLRYSEELLTSIPET